MESEKPIRALEPIIPQKGKVLCLRGFKMHYISVPSARTRLVYVRLKLFSLNFRLYITRAIGRYASEEKFTEGKRLCITRGVKVGHF